MKVLSDWQSGTPPMPGMWLVRQREFADVDAGEMLMWNGQEFVTIIGSRPIFIGAVEWRGLAFDPEEAARWGDNSNGTFWLVREPKP